MYRGSNPQDFIAPQRVGQVIPLHVTDERGQPIRIPRTVEEANGLETAPTMHPNASQPQATVDIRTWPFAQILVALLDLQCSSPRAAELYQTLTENETEITLLLSEVREAEIAKLREQHERVLGECRSVLREIARLEAELPALETLLRRRQSEMSPLRARLAGVRAAEPSVNFPHYATKSQIQAWRDQVAEAQTELAEAETAEAAVVGDYNTIVNKIKAQRELLNGHKANIAAVNDTDRPGLVEMEQRLRAQIEGREWTDSTTGLSSKTAILR